MSDLIGQKEPSVAFIAVGVLRSHEGFILFCLYQLKCQFKQSIFEVTDVILGSFFYCQRPIASIILNPDINS
ncbi:hypothetical protein SPHINGO8BC_10066 [Sphingobacterium multivorum]|uniref:Uncharacterized protein n=1 Tax=Sphingobacterium multivorum TaxID=28454 RepID=A0A653XM16_SPHMU|nr:hypothetical protein SPHINGO8BC_10066 [Sphingobacterium multivorum]